MPTPHTYYLLPSVVKQLNTHAMAGYPHEVCGILYGDRRARTVVMAQPTTNRARAGHKQSAFAIGLLEVLMARWAMRKLNRGDWKVMGFYHSHPNAPATPSGFDIRCAWPEHLYLIGRVQHGTNPRRWRGWLITAGHAEEQTIIIP